ncbi:hypothetical protein D1872_267800 [compost metagenome]
MRKRIGDAVGGHAAFLHDLQQRGLRFGRRPVDFIRQEDICHYRTWPEHKPFLMRMKYRNTGNIAR